MNKLQTAFAHVNRSSNCNTPVLIFIDCAVKMINYTLMLITNDLCANQLSYDSEV